MDLQLTNKLALVTGSTAGIGLAIAKTMAQEGATVIVNGRSQDSVEEAISQVQSEATGKVMGLVADLSSNEGVSKATEQYSQLDILVNNLGLYKTKSFNEITDDDWQKLLILTL